MKKTILMTLLLVIFQSAITCAQPSGITNGLNYLLSTQSSDGSWSGSATIEALPATVTVMETLLSIGQRKTATYAHAASWLSGQTLKTTDYMAERIQALTVGDSDNITLLAYLNRLSYAWGGYKDYGVNILDTALALQALKSANYPDLSIINPALAYLIGCQNPDGGWGFYRGDDSNVYMTAVVSTTLQPFPQTTTLASALNKATNYLLTLQNSDGGFGNPSSTVHETALAYSALVAVITDATVLGKAVNYLTATQAADGSWLQDPYSTALALRTLHYAENRPAPPPPSTGTLVGKVIDAAGGGTLAGVTVSLTGNPAVTTVTDGAGSFTIAGISQGSQQLTISLNGYNSATLTTTVTGGAIVNLGLIPLSATPTTETTGVVQGIVTDAATHSPLAGVVITVTGTSSWTSVTAIDGTFKITDIAPGAVTLTTAKEGYPSATGHGTVTAGEVLVFSPALSVAPPTTTTGELQGSVVDAVSGLPIAGATVTLTSTRPPYTTTTTMNGIYSIVNVEPGDYVITFTASGYYARSGNFLVNISAGSVADLGAFRLTPAPTATTIRGKVTDSATGTPIADAEVSVTGTKFTTKTDTSGVYVISGINLLEFEVKASSSDYDTKAFLIRSSFHDDLTVDFNLDPNRWGHVGIVSAMTDRQSYQAYADVAITAEVLNTDLLPMNASVSVSIMNAQGEVIDVLQGSVLDPDGVAQSNITFQPGIAKTVNIAWGTGYYPPGVYNVLVKLVEDTPAIGTVIVAQHTLTIEIEPTQAISSLVLTPMPRFANLGADEQVSLQASLVNHSNVPTEITFSYTWKSPSGLLLHTGSGTIFAQPVEIAKSVLVETFPLTFTESGDHPLQVQITTGPSPLELVAGSLSVAPGIRIEPSQSLTPSSVIPDGNQRVRVNIKLKGVVLK